MRRVHRLALVAVGVVTTAAALPAQRTEGVTASIGLAFGSLSTSLSDNADEHVSGSQGAATGSIALGWAFSDEWRVALQFDQVDATNYLVSQLGSGTEVITSYYTASVAYYPGSRSNFWVRANVGMGHIEVGRADGNGSATNFAGGLGVGYDWKFGRTTPFAAVPYISYLRIFNTGDFGGALSGLDLHGSAGLLEVGVALGFGN